VKAPAEETKKLRPKSQGKISEEEEKAKLLNNKGKKLKETVAKEEEKKGKKSESKKLTEEEKLAEKEALKKKKDAMPQRVASEYNAFIKVCGEEALKKHGKDYEPTERFSIISAAFKVITDDQKK